VLLLALFFLPAKYAKNAKNKREIAIAFFRAVSRVRGQKIPECLKFRVS